MKTLFLLLTLLTAVLFSSCAAFTNSTGIGREAPVSVSQKGELASLIWSAANCPDEWDKEINPLNRFVEDDPKSNTAEAIRASHMSAITGHPDPAFLWRDMHESFVP